MKLKSFIKENAATILRSLFLFVVVLASGIIIFRNNLLYKDNAYISKTNSDGILVSYNISDTSCSPTDGGAYIYIDNVLSVIDEVEFSFDKSLGEETKFSLYASYADMSEGAYRLVDTKSIKKGANTVTFYTEKIEMRSIIVKVLNANQTFPIVIPTFTVNLNQYVFQPFQNNLKWTSIFTSVLVVSLLVTTLSIVISQNIKKHSPGAESASLARSNPPKKEEITTVSTLPSTPNKQKTRSSNFELLRVICMLCLIGHHFAVHGGLLSQEANTVAYSFGVAFLPIGKICFIAFIAISMWFLCDSKTNLARFLKVWLEVLFYSVVFTVISFLMDYPLRPVDFISSFFVMIGNSHGFAASYLIFVLILPFLLFIAKRLTKKQTIYLLIVLFFVQIGAQILNKYTNYVQPVFSEPLLFVFCFFLSLFLKKWPIKIFDNKIFSLTVLIAIYSLMIVNNTVASSNAKISFFIYVLSIDESSVLFIIAGYALFFLFKNIHVKENKFINFVASSSFAVLLIHDHNFFRHLFWFDVVKTSSFFHSQLFVLYFVLTVILIYFVCSTIDYLRKKLLEDPIFRIPVIQRIIDKYNTSFNKES